MSELGFQSALAACTRSAQAQTLRSEANVLWGRLNLLSRRDQLERSADVARLADCWLAFESIRTRIRKVEWKAETDPRVALMVREMRMIEDDLRDKFKSHAENVGDYTCVLAPGQWARRILAGHKAAEAEKAARRSQRQPPKRTAKRPRQTSPATASVKAPARPARHTTKMGPSPVLKVAGRTYDVRSQDDLEDFRRDYLAVRARASSSQD